MERHDKNLLAIFAVVIAIFILLNIGAFLAGPTGLAGYNESNSAPVWSSGSTYFGMVIDSELVLDLNEYFTDADGDTLSFIATQPNNFTVVVSDNVVAITTDQGFLGTRSITLTASDDVDVTSQTILVDVLETTTDIKDANNKFFGKKLADEPSFETYFSSLEKTDNQLTVVFYHDSAVPKNIWVEGDVGYALTKDISGPLEEVLLVVQLVEGIVPKFKLHVGEASEIFEFGKEIPAVVTSGNYSLIDRDDELLDVEITKEGAAAVIKGTNNSVIKADLGEIINSEIKTDVFAAEDIFMEEAVISLPASGEVNAILECSDFNVDTFVCEGKWEDAGIPFTVSDNNVIFTVDHFSGYAGGYINIINVQSYPTLNGNWTVRFNTIGNANLTITGVSGTHFTVDLQFLELKCGNSTINASYDGNIVFYENFSCNETAYETSRVITEGRHHLNFSFGNSSAVAHNIVVVGSQSVTSVLNASFYGENPGDLAGRAIALGDIDGDNTSDLVIGALTRNESGKVFRGKMYLVYGNFTTGSHNLSTANASWLGANNRSFAGSALLLADFNNDSLKDITVSAFGDNTSGVNFSGTVYIINGGNLTGNQTLGPATVNHTFTSAFLGGYFGWSLAAGDFNNDTVLDLAVGEPAPFAGSGTVYVFFGPFAASTKSAIANVTIIGTSPTDQFGMALAVGDINGDGVDDLHVGAPNTFPAGPLGTGGVFTFYGPLAPGIIVDIAANVQFMGEFMGDLAGFSLSSGKDVNNDTFDDLLIGAPKFDFIPPIVNDDGKVYLVYGNGTLPAFYPLAGANVSWYGEALNDSLGASVLLSFENNDTLADVVMGAPGNDFGANNAGRIYFRYAPIPSAFHVNVSTVNGSLFGTTPNIGLGSALASGTFAVGKPSTNGDVNLFNRVPFFEPIKGLTTSGAYTIGEGGPGPKPLRHPRPTGDGSDPPPSIFNPCDPNMFDPPTYSSQTINGEEFVTMSIPTTYPGEVSVVFRGIGTVATSPKNGVVTATTKLPLGFTGDGIDWAILPGSSFPYEANICTDGTELFCEEQGELKEEPFVMLDFTRPDEAWGNNEDWGTFVLFSIPFSFGKNLPESAALEYCPSLFGEKKIVEQPIRWTAPDLREVYLKNLCRSYCAGYYYYAATGEGGGGPTEELDRVGEFDIGFGGIVMGGSNSEELVYLGAAIFGDVVPEDTSSTGYAWLPGEASKGKVVSWWEEWTKLFPDLSTGESHLAVAITGGVTAITGSAVAGQLVQYPTQNPHMIMDDVDMDDATEKCIPPNSGEEGGDGVTDPITTGYYDVTDITAVTDMEPGYGDRPPEFVHEEPGWGEWGPHGPEPGLTEGPPYGWPGDEPWPPVDWPGGEGPGEGEGEPSNDQPGGTIDIGEGTPLTAGVVAGQIPKNIQFSLPDEIRSTIACTSDADCAAGSCSYGLCVPSAGMGNPNRQLRETNPFFSELLARVYDDSWILNVNYASACAELAPRCSAMLGAGANAITTSAVADTNAITGSAAAGSSTAQQGAQAPGAPGDSGGIYGCGSGYGSPPTGGSVGQASMMNNYDGVPEHCVNWFTCSPCPMSIDAKKTPEIEQEENPTIGQFKKPCPGLVPFCGVDGNAYLLYVDPGGLRNPVGFSIPDLEPVEPGLLGYLLGWTNMITGSVTAGLGLPQGNLMEVVKELAKKVYTNQEIADKYCVEEETYCAVNGRCLSKCPKPEPPVPEPGPPPVPPPLPPRPGPPGPPGPPPEVPGPPVPPPIDGTIDTHGVDGMPNACSVVSWRRKDGSVTAQELVKDVAVPEGYELIAGPISFDCLEDDLDIKFNVPDNYKDIRAFRCSESSCSAVSDVSVYIDELICDGMPLSEHRRIEMLSGDTYLPAAEIEVIERYEALVSSNKKSLSTQGYVFEFPSTVPSGTLVGLFSPDFNVPLAANPSIAIISTPLVVEFDQPVPSGIDARITMPFDYTENFDKDSIAIYLLQDGMWIRLESTIEDSTVSAYLYDIAKYIQDNKLVFAVMAVRCDACIVSEFKNVYDPRSRDAIILIHGLTSSSKTWQFLIDDYAFNRQPWQIWTFDYPSYMTVDEMSKDLADAIQMNNAKFDNIYIVGHSLGGFIGQRTLEIADENPSVYSFINKVKKLILAGNPGKGSPAAEVYDNLFNELLNIRSVAKAFNLNSEVIDDMVEGRQFTRVDGVKYYVIAGSQPYVFNLGFFTLTTGAVFELLGINDGIVTTDSASFIGGEYIQDACRDYFEIKLTHTELIDEAVPRRIIARIIAEEKAAEDPDFAYLGYNKYVDLLVDMCDPDEYFIIVGKRITELETPAPLNCNCGNGVCGEGEDYDNCPQDCAGIFSLAGFCMMLPILILLLLLLLVILTFVYIIRKRVQKKEVGPVWKTVLWFLILLNIILLLLLLFICKYIPWWYWLILILIALVIIIDALVPWKQKKKKLEEIKKGRPKLK